MLYVQQFQNIRLDYLRQCQRLNLSVDQNFSLCSNQYSKKFPKLSRSEIPNVDYPRSQTLFFLTSKSSSETVNTCFITSVVFFLCSTCLYICKR